MGGGCSSLSPPLSSSCSLHHSSSSTTTTKTLTFTPPFSLPTKRTHPTRPIRSTSSSSLPPEGQEETKKRTVPEDLVGRMTADALVWSALHGLVVGDRSVPKSGTVPGVGLVHAPFSLLPMIFPRSHWSQARELAPIFNELVDRVSLDGKFLQDSLFRINKVDAFTGRLLDIHSKMLEIKKTEDIRLGLFRSDYMLDNGTNLLFQIELNTISSSFPGLSCLVSELHRNLLNHYGKDLGLYSREVPGNNAVSGFAEALAKAWREYGKSSAVVLVVVQPEERNMYDQYWLSTILKDIHGVTSIRRTLAEVDAEGQMLSDGTLLVGDQPVAVIYFRAGYTPNDYPSETEWAARFMIEQSSAIKCPSISYHLVGIKKIQQELAKPDILERFLDSEDDIAKLRKCFAGLWSLDNSEGVKAAMERPELFVLKPQREGGGNNIYGDDVRETLVRLQEKGSEALAAYILMQRIFPTPSHAYLVQEGICHKKNTVSELGVYGAYLRYGKRNIFQDSLSCKSIISMNFAPAYFRPLSRMIEMAMPLSNPWQN